MQLIEFITRLKSKRYHLTGITLLKEYDHESFVRNELSLLFVSSDLLLRHRKCNGDMKELKISYEGNTQMTESFDKNINLNCFRNGIDQ